jgi:hypothetical protein
VEIFELMCGYRLYSPDAVSDREQHWSQGLVFVVVLARDSEGKRKFNDSTFVVTTIHTLVARKETYFPINRTQALSNREFSLGRSAHQHVGSADQLQPILPFSEWHRIPTPICTFGEMLSGAGWDVKIF